MINAPRILADLKRRLPLLDDELSQKQTRILVEQAVGHGCDCAAR